MDARLALLFVTLLCSAMAATLLRAAPPNPAAEMNGFWKSGRNTMKVWALGEGKVQVEFKGSLELKPGAGSAGTFGFATGIASQTGDTAVLLIRHGSLNGSMTMKFTGGQMIVEQKGNCGFPLHVDASGIYSRAYRQKPDFWDGDADA